MALQTPLTRTRAKPEIRGKEPRKAEEGKRPLLMGLAACGIAGPVCFVAAWIVAGLLYPGYSQLTQATSELTSRGAPPAAATVANLGLAALGLCMIAFACGLSWGIRRSRWLLSGAALVALFGLICLGHLFFPMNPAAGASSWQNVMHNVLFVADSVTVIPALLLFSVAFARDPGFRPYRWYTLLTPFLMGLASLDLGLFPAGVPERLSSMALLVWIEVVAVLLLRLAWQRRQVLVC